MWNPFRAARLRREREDARRFQEQQAFLETLSLMAENFSKVQEASHLAVAELARASEAQASALREHLALFSIHDKPQSRVMRDFDEYQAELARMEPQEQMAWVLQATASDE